MAEPPRRRSRPQPPGRGGSLPFVPVIAGVVILGFVIGAGLSVVGKHGGSDPDVALATATPTAIPQLPATPVAVLPTRIPGNARAPRPATTQAPPSAAPRSTRPPATPSPRATQKPLPAVRTSASGTPAPIATASAAPAASAAATASATAAPAHRSIAAATIPSSTPAPLAPSPAPAATVAPPSAAPTTAFDADGEFSRLAGNVVRQYLLAISRGDLESANAALGNAPGSRSAIPEASSIDATLKISKIQARGNDSSATVNVDCSTGAGSYYGQYSVRKSSTGAAIIVSHTFGRG